MGNTTCELTRIAALVTDDSLRDTLVRYRRAVRDAAASSADNAPDDDIPF